MTDLEGLSRDALKSRAETFQRQYRNVSQDHAMAIAENQRLRAALEKIFAVGDGYGPNTKERPCGTTGDGHAQCRQIARAALLPKDGTP